jgi:signal transduction histidine kinase
VSGFDSDPETLFDSVRVVVVDDVPEVRNTLAQLLDDLGLDVVGVAADGVEALEVVDATLPQVVLMDLRMPRMDGVEATRAIIAEHPEVAVLMLSAYGDESLVIDALMAGARGYLLKGAPAAELAEAVAGVAGGQSRLAGQVTRPLLERLVDALKREHRTRQVAEQARRTSEQLLRHQQQFATVAAHELRTPVTALLLSLGTLQRLLSQDRMTPQELDMLNVCIRRTRRLARLVEDLVLVAEDAGGGISVSLTVVDVGQAISGVVADLDHLGADRVRVKAEPGLRARADSDRLMQVLTNLVRNALQYSRPHAPIEVVASAADDVVQISVSDQGPGIPPERIPELFDRFGERNAGNAGLGVGLWIVRELLTAMHGSVWVENNAKGGSTFWVAVPSARHSDEREARAN